MSEVFQKDWLEKQGLLSRWDRMRLALKRTYIAIDFGKNGDFCVETKYKRIDGKIVIIDWKEKKQNDPR